MFFEIFRIVYRTTKRILDRLKIPHTIVHKLVVLYLIVWSISPPLQVDMKFRLLALASVGVYFFLIICEKKPCLKIHIWAILFAVAVFGVAYIQTRSINGTLKQIAMYMLVICFIINYFYQGQWHKLSGIIPFVLVLLTIWNLKTVEVLLDDPTIARLIVRGDAETFVYLRRGIGGYGLIYPQVCIFPAFLAWVMKAFRHNKLYFGIGAIWLTSYILFLMEAGYSIAIFASAVGAIILLFHKGRNVAGSLLTTVLIFAGTLALIVYVDGFRNMLLDVFEGTAVTKKINDLMSTSETGDAEGSIWIRMAMYGASLRTIFTYPIIGGLWMASGSGHSAFLDAFAKYGLWGGYMYAKMIYYVPGHYKRKTNHRFIVSISNATMVTLVFVSVLDSFPYNFMSVVLLVLPLLYEDIIKWEKIEI